MLVKYRGLGSDSSVPSVLDLNFIPVEVESPTVRVFAIPYPGDDEFRALPGLLGEGCSAWRDFTTGNTVYLWSESQSEPPGGLQAAKKELAVTDHPVLVSRMVLDAFENELVRMGFTELGHHRKCFVNFNKGNLLAAIEDSVDSRVGVYPKISMNSFFTSFGNGEHIYGLLADIATLVRLDVPLSELLKQGMDCRGLYLIFKDREHAYPKLGVFEGCTVGKLIEIDNGKARMTDLRDPTLQRIDVSTLYVEPNKRNLKLYLEAVRPGQAKNILEELRDELARFHSPKRKWEMLEGFKRKFFTGGQPREIECGGGLRVHFAHAYQPREDSTAFRFSRLRGAVFNHDYESPKTTTRADEGLKTYGPYDRDTFLKKDVKVLVISPEEHKGEVEKFIKQFENGFRDDPDSVFTGFRSKYHLRSVAFKDAYFPLSNDGLAHDYENACLAALKQGNDYDLCFLVIRHDFEFLPTTENPYYVGKALLLSQGIPVQEVKIETLRRPFSSLRYILNNIGLACYAKLGGTPYVLRAEEVVREELVIGIGRSIDRETRLARGKQVVGFTAVFKNNGDFLLSSCTPYCDFSDYEEHLEEAIVSSVNRVAEREAYEEGEEIRIIFHVFKRTGQRENRAVQRALDRLGKYKIEYALLHVNDSHLFRIFDRTNVAASEWTKHYVAPRGISIEIGPRERLINLIGPRQYLGRGCPMPLKLTLDTSSTFKDIGYLCQQLYEFSFMSWRGFNPTVAPATLLYSEWIAKLNSKLRHVPNWNQHMLRTQLAEKRWFL
jgi:hypothetical protein